MEERFYAGLRTRNRNPACRLLIPNMDRVRSIQYPDHVVRLYQVPYHWIPLDQDLYYYVNPDPNSKSELRSGIYHGLSPDQDYKLSKSGALSCGKPGSDSIPDL